MRLSRHKLKKLIEAYDEETLALAKQHQMHPDMLPAHMRKHKSGTEPYRGDPEVLALGDQLSAAMESGDKVLEKELMAQLRAHSPEGKDEVEARAEAFTMSGPMRHAGGGIHESRKISRTQLKRIIREEKRKVVAEKRIRSVVRRRLLEARGAMFAADIQEPAVMADEMGMSPEEYIQLYIDAANKAGVKIVENTPDMFTVQGPEKAVVNYGFQVNQMEGGPSFNEAEFREYAMYEV